MKKFTRVTEYQILQLKKQSDNEVYIDDMNAIDKRFKSAFPESKIQSSWLQRGVLAGDVVLDHGTLTLASEYEVQT